MSSKLAEIQIVHERGGWMAAGPRPCPIRQTQFLEIWILSQSDSAQIEGRGVRESHPTPVSQGFRSLALLGFEFEPAKSSFRNTP